MTLRHSGPRDRPARHPSVSLLVASAGHRHPYRPARRRRRLRRAWPPAARPRRHHPGPRLGGGHEGRLVRASRWRARARPSSSRSGASTTVNLQATSRPSASRRAPSTGGCGRRAPRPVTWTAASFTRNGSPGRPLLSARNGAALAQPYEPPLLCWTPVWWRDRLHRPGRHRTPTSSTRSPATQYSSKTRVMPGAGPAPGHDLPLAGAGVTRPAVSSPSGREVRAYVDGRARQARRCVSPATDAFSNVEDVVLDWNPVLGAETYDLQISTDNQFLNTSSPVNGIVGTRWSPADDAPQRPALLARAPRRPPRQQDRLGQRRHLDVPPALAGPADPPPPDRRRASSPTRSTTSGRRSSTRAATGSS